MKKNAIAALALSMGLCLCACGQAQTAAQTDPQPLSPVVEEIPASESSLSAQVQQPPASETDAQPEGEMADDGRMALAQEYIGRGADELIAALGEPDSREYAASCEEENAEDGMLMYDGFYVWTLRTADEELVRDVYPDD